MCIPLDSANPGCKPVNSSTKCLNYSQAVGVRCQAREDTCTAIITDTPIPEMVYTVEQSIGGDFASVSPSSTSYSSSMVVLNSIPAEFPKNGNIEAVAMCSENNNLALGVLTGLIAAALVVVTMGWIVSCVYWQRRNKQR